MVLQLRMFEKSFAQSETDFLTILSKKVKLKIIVVAAADGY